MRTTLHTYVIATLATVAISPAGARAGSMLVPTSPEGPTKAVAPRNSCGRPDVPARLARPVPIDLSQFDAIAGHHGSASVAVTLAPDGRLLKAAVFHSSGNARFDENALQAIRQSTFTPEQRNCGNVGGTYNVEADSAAGAE